MKKFIGCVCLVMALVLNFSFMPQTVQAKAKTKSVYFIKGEKGKLFSVEKGQKVSVKVSKKSIAKVSKKGKITAKRNGKTKVKATINGKKYKWNVIVEDVGFANDASSLLVGEKETFSLSNTSQKVKWTSSNKQVAAINKKGTIFAKKSGNVTITGKYRNHKFAKKIKIETLESRRAAATKNFYFNSIHRYLPLSEGPVSLDYTVTPNTLPASEIVWKSSNPSVAIVQDGVVTPIGYGETTISVLYAKGTVKMTVTVGKDKNPYSDVHMIGHRGCSLAPENTILAYQIAKEKGFGYAECDVSWTKDNVPVLLHDNSIRRTSNYIYDTPIGEMMFDEINQYDFGSWKSAKFKGTKIPKFDEYIAYCKKAEIRPYVEIKGSSYREQGMLLANIVKDYGMEENVTWVGFSQDSLKSVQEVIPQARLAYLVKNIDSDVIEKANELKNGSNEVVINMKHENMTLSQLRMIGNAGFKLEAWTVDSASEIKKALTYGATGITTNKAEFSKIDAIK